MYTFRYLIRSACLILLFIMFAIGISRAATSPPLAFTINALTASPTTVVPGQTIAFSTTVAANKAAAGYLVTLWWYPGTTHNNAGSSVQPENFVAGQPLTGTASWTVPAGTAPGSYTLVVSIYPANWSVNYATTSITFTVAAAGTPVNNPPVANTPVNGACGTSNGKSFTAAPTANLCLAGDASHVVGSGPFSWSCTGSNGGTTALCSASLLVAVNGKVGSASGQTFSSLTSGSANLCMTGAVANFASTATGWSWSCAGANGGSTDNSGTATQLLAQSPGPSLALFNAPYYSCVSNYYVSPTGSDSAAGTAAAPWLTLQHANNSGSLKAGACVNVAPGTYASGVVVSAGGSAASSTGYVVYRCTTMDACIVTDTNAGGYSGTFVWRGAATANYVIVDGFTLRAAKAGAYGQGIEVYNGSNSWPASGSATNHHVWVLNSVISGYGQSGVQMNQGDYFYIVHNTIFGNASVTCDSQGSGISLANEIEAANYTPTADDQNNPVVGTVGNAFRQFVMWNVVYNNAITGCGTPSNAYDTDGNGIIADTWNWDRASGTTPYAGGGLFAFNISMNNGGGGIVLTQSQFVTVANNTVFNSYIDPSNSGSGRGMIFGNNSYGNTFVNNIAVAIPAAHSSCSYSAAPYAMWNSAMIGSPPSSAYAADVFSRNVTWVGGGNASCQGSDVQAYNGDSFSASLNKTGTNPQWVNVGTTTVGTEVTPPVGVNFALGAGSPAIGYGLAKSYLPASAVDAGACSHALTSCP
jgi:hypothetical protein